jgi:hypothetical protein
VSEHWIHKGFSLLFIVFCLELGLFLLVYPWTLHWQVNTIPSWVSFLLPVWNSDYLRGAVSGIGVLNLWVAVLEMFHFRRMTRRLTNIDS